MNVSKDRVRPGFVPAVPRRWVAVAAGVAVLGWVAPRAMAADGTTVLQPRQVFSPNGQHFVRVIPGAGFAAATPGGRASAFAVAEFYQRNDDQSYRLMAKAAMAHALGPAEFHVSDQGHLATLDSWRTMGADKVVSLYSASGRLVRAYELSDLFDPDEVATLPRTRAGVAWREGAGSIAAGQATLTVQGRGGAQWVFGLETGRYRYCEPRGTSTRCRLGDVPRRWFVDSSVPLER